MRCTPLVAALALAVLPGCGGAEEPVAAPAPLCSADQTHERCHEVVRGELSRLVAQASAGGPADHDDLEQALAEVLRSERIGFAHGFTRVTDPPGPAVDGSVATTPVEFRLGIGNVQRTLWACLPSTEVVSPGPCPPAP